ncbi:hypothetical protein JYU34_009107 [Plutella xylostella]|uniref:Male-enhanced antigen 1 n=1 Tax=Plutella xylostella TaxID=51655 RepID=A0ABQ7QN52_PLUXY|nr:hypothetical protein JYU34_009107 [Plutella xylostella]
MVCDGPDPPENTPQDLTPPPMHSLMMEGPQVDNEDSDEEANEYDGYQPLPQGPEGFIAENGHSDSENEMVEEPEVPRDPVPPIEPMDRVITREVWSEPRQEDPIQMDSERAQQVMSAMANFELPQTSIPQWAQCITEDQWKQTLRDKIDTLNNK